ncbi:MAG: hypothetical protein ABIE36_01535 [Candidatus Diapherotrites archaeon]
METKTLYSLLKEKDYQVRGDSERKKLQEACKEYMQANQQALWYSDLHKGVYDYIKDLYLAGKIPSETTRNKTDKFLEWDIKHYFERNPEAKISESKLRKKLHEEHRNNFCRNTAFSEIEKSCKENSASFNVEDIYQILRKYHNIPNYYTKMSIQPPIYLIDTSLDLNDTNKRKFEELRQKGISLNNKRMGGKAERDLRTMEGIRTRYADDYGTLDSAVSPIYYDFNPEKQDKFIAESISGNYGSLYREMDVLGNLAREYRNIATKLPIAYTDTKNAIDFFETETGILLNKSKDESTVYEKFLFGK